MEHSNKRMLLLLIFVSICSGILVFSLVRNEMLSAELSRTQLITVGLQHDLAAVLDLAQSSKVKLDTTTLDVRKVVAASQEKDSVTLEHADGGIEIVVRPQTSGPQEDRPVVKIPVTVPTDLKVTPEDPPKRRSPAK